MFTQNRIRNLLTLAAVATVALAASANAALVGQLGVLTPAANGGINPATGVAWADGDTYRLAFVSSTSRNATSPDIADYHAHVQAAANAAGLGGATWYNIGQSANNPDRAVNAYNNGSTNVGIFLVNGFKLADDVADLNNGPDTTFSITELGTSWTGNVATGSNRQFGSVNGPPAKNETGSANSTGAQWWQIFNTTQTNSQRFYAISGDLQFQEDAPVIPAPAALPAGLALMGVMLVARRRSA